MNPSAERKLSLREFKRRFGPFLQWMGIAALAIVAAMLLITNLFAFHHLKNPQSIPNATHYINIVLESRNLPFKVEKGTFQVYWQGFGKAVGVDISNLAITNGTNMAAELSALSVTLMPVSIWRGKWSLTGASGQGLLVDFLHEPTDETQSAGEKRTNLRKIIERLSVANIDLQDVAVRLDSEDGRSNWEIPYIRVSSGQDAGVRQVNLTTAMRSEHSERLFNINANTVIDADSNAAVTANCEGFPPILLYYLAPQLHWGDNIDGLIGGSLTLQMDAAGDVRDASFSVALQDLEQEGKPSFYAAGDYKNHRVFDRAVNIPELSGEVIIENMPAERLADYWPQDVGPNPRAWVTESIKKGFIPKATAQFHLKPSDFIAPMISRESVAAEVIVEDALVEYHPKLPSLTGAFGVARFDGQSMVMTISKASSGDMKLLKGEVTIPNIGTDEEYIVIEGEAEGSVKGLLSFLALKQAADEKPLNVTGSGRYKFMVELSLLLDLPKELVKIELDSTLSNIALPDGVAGMKLGGGNFTLKGNADLMRLAGTAAIEDAPANIAITYDFTENAKVKTLYEISSSLSPAQLGKMGLGDMASAFSGTTALSINLQEQQKSYLLDATMDMKDVRISLPDFSFSKAVGRPLALKVEGSFASLSAMDSVPFSVAGEGVEATGAVKLAEGKLGGVEVSKLVFGRNDLALTYRSAGEKSHIIKIVADKLDMEPFLKDSSKNNDDDDAAFDVDINAKQLFMQNGEIWSGVNGKVICAKDHCVTADMRGSASDGSAWSLILVRGGNRVFTVKVANAGLFLKALDVSTQVVGGTIDATLTLDREPKGNPAKGNFIIKDFTVVKAPVLTRILTLASLTGILDVLQGNGINFTKFEGQISLKNKVVTFEQTRANGSSLGITAEGTLNTKTNEVDINGVVIPSYSLNNALGSVPVVGNILIGGKGEGIVGINYSVKGDMDKPSVMANPLSALTPGFLRGIFDIPGNMMRGDESGK